MGKSQDLTEFERGMIVGVRMAGKSISETVGLLGFSRTAVSRVYREWCDYKKTSSQRQASGRKRLVDETKMEQLVKENSHATCEQIQALYNSSGVKTPISHRTTRRTLKRLGFSSRMSSRRDDLTLEGLEALAAYTSRLEKMETSAERVGISKDEPAACSQVMSDSVSSNDSALDLTSPASEVSAR